MRLLPAVLTLLLFPMIALAGSLLPVNLRCESATEPTGVQSPAPNLFWKLQSSGNGTLQTAYQILVASSLEALQRDEGTLWATDRVTSSETVAIPYGGKLLGTGDKAYWKVRAWDQAGKPSPWSEPATWTMGVLTVADWKEAQWITGEVVEEWLNRTKLGYVSATGTEAGRQPWIQVDLGSAKPIDQIEIYPIHWEGKPGYAFPPRYKIELSDEKEFKHPIPWVDRATEDQPNPGAEKLAFAGSGTGRFVRFTAVKEAIVSGSIPAFGISQMTVLNGGSNVALQCPVSSSVDPAKGPWKREAITDGVLLLTENSQLPPRPANDPRTDSLLLRRMIDVRRGLKQATVFICGLGQYTLTANGKPARDSFLDPGWSQYEKSCLYDTLDITSALHPGRNALGVLLGNGFYNKHAVVPGRYDKGEFKPRFQQPCLIARVQLRYADGTVEDVVTNDSWEVRPGPLTLSHIYAGEDFDARKLPLGWDLAENSAAPGWTPALPTSGPGGELKGMESAAPPIRRFELFHPVSSKELKPGITVHDFGQNAAVILKLRVKGTAGSVVRVEPAELLADNGDLFTGNIRGNDTHAYWTYTLKGGDEELYEARFFYQGARYFRVEQIAAPDETELPQVLEVASQVVHANAEATGTFACSNELFNQTYHLIRWAQLSNLMSVITDCPTREKLGWLEQHHLNGPSLHYNWDLYRVMRKALHDMADNQTENGFVSTTAPTYAKFSGGFLDSPEWGSSSVVVPWQVREFYGGKEILRDSFPLMRGFTSYLESKAKANIVDYGLGDWYDIGPKPPNQAQLTPKANTGTAYLFYNNRILAQTARLLGEKELATRYENRAKEVRESYNAKLFNKEKGVYGNDPKFPVGSQCAQAMPLFMGIVPDELRETVVRALIADVEAKGNTAGDVGYRYVLRALADSGHSEQIFRMNNQSTKPGYGMQLAKGATALTEAWDAGRGSSHNHFMLGQLNEWLFHDLAGIQCDPQGPGFEKIVIRPAIVGDFQWVEAAYDSVRGKIQVRWERNEKQVRLRFTIPPNTTATVYLPADPGTKLLAGKRTAKSVPGLRVLKRNNDGLVLRTEAGTYDVTTTWTGTRAGS